MPFGNQEVIRCPRCNQAVFHAEAIPAAGKQWHKTCYRCGLCKKMLEPMIMAEHEGNIYCKQCYGRKFGIRGVGFGVGAGALAMDTGDRFGNTESLTNKPNYATPPGASLAGKAVPEA
ncbi:unnamed protein product [Rotaria sp. Silwood1]|nr:unnamed protein product [Rotaria sp. Silwood1]CAF3678225.1 unnamed protein product [Rotaria sp. Silwood1]CAF3699600.1 unnamed protein product [Rotaria sp. Silwood1]CAF3813625.1 unnamed protein product [Rotaria sp. Silwood1]CAF4976178.1 unnamed protein product [Rotaria sp. Silwood1]